MPGARYHHGDLRNALVRAAREIVAADGVAGLGLRKAARRAGASHAAPAHHFGDLDGLLAAVAVDGFGRLRAALERAAAGAEPGGTLAQLEALVLAYVRFASAEPGPYRAMFHPRLAERGARADVAAAADAALAPLVDAVEACQVAGELRPGDPRELALAAWAAAHGLATLWSDSRIGAQATQGIEDLARRTTALLFHGLRA